MLRVGVDVAAVETLNRGRLRLAEQLELGTRPEIAAVAATQLLHRADLTAQVDSPEG